MESKYTLLLDLSPLSLAIVILVAALAGAIKVAFGIGTGVFLTPLLALVIAPRIAVGLMAPLMIVTDITALQHHWRKWHVRHMLVLLPTEVVGMLLGIWFLAAAPSQVIGKAIGTIALLYVVLQLVQRRRQGTKPTRPMPAWGGWVVGFVAGVATSLAHAGGVVLSIYLLTQGLAKDAFIATLVGVFFAGNALKMPLYWEAGVLNLPILLTGLAMTPAMLLGGRFGMTLHRRVSVEQFKRVVIVVVGLSGLLLIASP